MSVLISDLLTYWPTDLLDSGWCFGDLNLVNERNSFEVCVCFGHLIFGHSILFRISCFDIRIFWRIGIQWVSIQSLITDLLNTEHFLHPDTELQGQWGRIYSFDNWLNLKLKRESWNRVPNRFPFSDKFEIRNKFKSTRNHEILNEPCSRNDSRRNGKIKATRFHGSSVPIGREEVFPLNIGLPQN